MPHKRDVSQKEPDILDVKKEAVEAIEHIESGLQLETKPLTDEDKAWLHGIDRREQNRIYHKVDRRLVPMLALLYLIAHLDRANIGNAKIESVVLGFSKAEHELISHQEALRTA